MLPDEVIALIKDELTLREMQDTELKLMVELMDSRNESANHENVITIALAKKIEELEGIQS
ncbi:hypothetical protein [Shewanella aestuarii]|uniref:Uncharacterized protein n=1 Tax=Shewanella aestuarii TaxID=1028752 RepID=A0A6G9QR43_9GAMM|nr:hypothetical protein [Shewanella aestuarii]QIR16525.1 hypothetical protein HBH39_18790 [Shewanella aestuarii]